MTIAGMSRRTFLELGATAAPTTLAPGWMRAQAAPPATDRLTQMRAGAANTPVQVTMLYDNVYLLQGAGGNMALQTGSEGKLLIDSSFSTAVPQVRAVMDALSKDPDRLLINTHWHFDHTDGNEGMHQAGFTIYAHEKTRERLSTPQTMKLFGFTVPAAPKGALPAITFERSMQAWHNNDSLDMVHFDPAHTDSDIYIHFHQADVLHVGDVWFNGMYPFIDEGTGGTIGGMIRADEKALAVVGEKTKIIPGHGPLGTKAQLQQFHDMLRAVRDRVAALKQSGASEQEAVAKNPTKDFDAVWGKGMMNGAAFTGIVYRTL